MKSKKQIIKNFQTGFNNSGVKLGYYGTIGGATLSVLLYSMGASPAGKYSLMGTGALFTCALLNNYKVGNDVLKKKKLKNNSKEKLEQYQLWLRGFFYRYRAIFLRK